MSNQKIDLFLQDRMILPYRVANNSNILEKSRSIFSIYSTGRRTVKVITIPAVKSSEKFSSNNLTYVPSAGPLIIPNWDPLSFASII